MSVEIKKGSEKMIILTLEYLIENKDNSPIQQDELTKNLFSIFNTKLSVDLFGFEHCLSVKFNLKKSGNFPERQINTFYTRKSLYELIFNPLDAKTCLKTINSVIADLEEKPTKIVITNE